MCQKRIKLAYQIRGELIKALSRKKKSKIQVYQIIAKTEADAAGKNLADGSVVHEELVEITEVDEDYNVINAGGDDDDDDNAIITSDTHDTNKQIFVQELKKLDSKPDEIEIDFLNENENELIIDDGQEDAVSFLLDKKELFQDSGANKSTGQRRHKCDACEKTFMRKSNLVDHLRLHANLREYKCQYCDKEFVQAGNYRSHLRVSKGITMKK